MDKSRYYFKKISDTRHILLGIATLIVIIFHSQTLRIDKLFNSTLIQNILFFVRDIGNVGVDIFLILSGLGLYYSFVKNENILEFYKRRYTRILPPVLIVTIIITALTKGNGFGYYLRNITMTALFTGEKVDYWYFGLIIYLYLLYPIFHKVIKKYDYKGMLFIVILSLLVNHFIRIFNVNLYSNIEIAITRIPVFIVGIYIGKLSYENKHIPKKMLLVFLGVFVITVGILYTKILTSHFYLIRYSYIFLATSIVILLSYVISTNNNIIERIFSELGKYSMEIYLLYEYLVKKCVNIFVYHDKYNVAYYMTVFVLTIILAYILKMVSDNIINNVLNKNKENIKLIKE